MSPQLSSFPRYSSIFFFFFFNSDLLYVRKYLFYSPCVLVCGFTQIYRLYAAAGADNCSDPTTNATFDYLGETLPSIYQTSLANVLIECLLILVRAEKHLFSDS